MVLVVERATGFEAWLRPATSISLFKAVHAARRRCGLGAATNGPDLPGRSSVKVLGHGFSRFYRGATLAALPIDHLELLRLNVREPPEAARAEVAVAPVALLPAEHAEEPSLPAAASTGCHRGSTLRVDPDPPKKCPEQPGRPSLASAVGFAVARSAFYVGLALCSITQDESSINQRTPVKSSRLMAILLCI